MTTDYDKPQSVEAIVLGGLIQEGEYRWRIVTVANQRTQLHRWGKFEGLPNPQISMKIEAVARGIYETMEDDDGNLIGQLTGEEILDETARPSMWKRFNLALTDEDDLKAQPNRQGLKVLPNLYQTIQGTAMPQTLNEYPEGGGKARYEYDYFAAAQTLQGLEFCSTLFHSTWNDKDTDLFKGAKEATRNNFAKELPTTIQVRRPQK